MKKYLPIGLLLVGSWAGCASFHATMVSRAENDSVYKDPCQPKCLQGVPVKLKVPSHLTIRIYEEQLLIQTDAPKDANGVATGDPHVGLVSFDPPQLRVDTETRYTDKVFLVDFRRPAAGTLEMLGNGTTDGVTFDQEQYFSKLKAKVEERTLRDITNVISTFPNTQVAGQQTANETVPLPPGVSTQQSLIAFAQFDIAEPDWEWRAQAFIDEHLSRHGAACPPGAVPASSMPMEGPPVEPAPPVQDPNAEPRPNR